MAGEKKTLSIEFDNEEALEHFASWLCEQGEQDYWEWMECRESEEDGDITAVRFNYFGPKSKSEFMADNIVRTQAGRMDKGWK